MNKKVIIKPLLISNTKKEEFFLEEMSKKGYELEKNIIRYIHIFKKSNDNERYIYQIDLHTGHSKNSQYYFQLFYDMGWEVAFKRGVIGDSTLVYFRKKYDDNEDDKIYTDAENKIETLEKLKKKWIPFSVFLTFGSIFCMAWAILVHIYGNINILVLLVLLLVGLINIININSVIVGISNEIKYEKNSLL